MPAAGGARTWLARWRRIRLDGRLPEQVERLLGTVLRLRARDLADRLAAAVRPVAGTRRWSIDASDGLVRRAGGRRWRVEDRLRMPYHDLAHEHAGVVTAALRSRDVAYRVIDAVPAGGLVLAVDTADRRRALAALRDPLVTDSRAWHLEWRRGHVRHVRLVGDGRVPSSAARADTWWVYTLTDDGTSSVGGRQQAVEVGFWERLAVGGCERLGERGLARFDATAEPTVEILDGRRYPGLSTAPVQHGLRRLEEPIDLVYTWVDGSDPAWRQQYDAWSERMRPGEQAVHPARFRSRDELRYSLRSAWAYAGWFRSIHLVTAGHVPEWLTAHDRVHVVEHSAILPPDALPTFNSHALEANLHRIPNLAEHFVYLNDDFFVGRPLAPTAFFTANGLAKVFEEEARIEGRFKGGPPRDADVAARNGADLIERRFGVRIGRKLHHAPFALRRSVLEQLSVEFAEAVEATTHSRFRSPTDVSVASAFAHHYGLCRGEAVLGHLQIGYTYVAHVLLSWHLQRLALGRSDDVFCLNETEAIAARPEQVDDRVVRFLEGYFPHPAPWER